jgi:nucleoside-diphosphate-sugar epimerase
VSLLLITGANGFIGSHVAERLLESGHRVRGLVRSTSDLGFIRQLDIDLRSGDVTDRESLARAADGVDIVVHVAGLASDWGPYERFYRVNVLGTRCVAETAHSVGVRRLVHISTTALHGFSGFRNADETFPMPETGFPYCETKRIAERWLSDYMRSTPMEISVIRPGNVFGPRDHTFVGKYLDALRDGKIAYLDGGCHWTCPTYVENLAEAIRLACFAPGAAGEAFIITDGLAIDWKTFTGILAAELGVPVPRRSVPYWLAYPAAAAMEAAYRMLRSPNPPLLTRYRVSNGGRDYHFSTEKARRLLRYVPLVGLDEAVRRTVSWYRRGS